MKESDWKILELVAHSLREANKFHSFLDYDHPYYKTLVAWGKQNPDEIVPWFLKRIETDWTWCFVLFDIVGKENGPIIAIEDSGRVKIIVSRWLAWGKEKGYI